eukprot:jgi/Picsp_1/5257/NSC_02619-R1_set domain-containing protein
MKSYSIRLRNISQDRSRATVVSVRDSLFDNFLSSRTGVQKTSHDPCGQRLLGTAKLGFKTADIEKVIVVGIAGQGRGLEATSLIWPSQQVVSLPLAAVITSDMARKSKSRVNNKYGDISMLSDWSVLALWLCQLRENPGSLGGEGRVSLDHYHERYREILPDSTGGILEWDERCRGLLKGSYLQSLADDILKAAELSYDEVCLIQHVDVARLDFMASLSILLSRLVRLEIGQKESIEALCPILDFANHAPESKSYIRYNPSANSVEIVADRVYKPGDQICINYGEKTNGEILLSYGFIPMNNPYDACLLDLTISNKYLETMMKGMDLPTQKVFPLQMSAIPEGLLRYAFLASVEPESKQEAKLIIDSLYPNGGAGEGNKDVDLSRQMKQQVLTWLLSYCKSKSSTYALGLQEAKDLATSSHSSDIERMIGQVILQEQRILARAQFIMAQMKRDV